MNDTTELLAEPKAEITEMQTQLAATQAQVTAMQAQFEAMQAQLATTQNDLAITKQRQHISTHLADTRSRCSKYFRAYAGLERRASEYMRTALQAHEKRQNNEVAAVHALTSLPASAIPIGGQLATDAVDTVAQSFTADIQSISAMLKDAMASETGTLNNQITAKLDEISARLASDEELSSEQLASLESDIHCFAESLDKLEQKMAAETAKYSTAEDRKHIRHDGPITRSLYQAQVEKYFDAKKLTSENEKITRWTHEEIKMLENAFPSDFVIDRNPVQEFAKKRGGNETTAERTTRKELVKKMKADGSGVVLNGNVTTPADAKEIFKRLGEIKQRAQTNPVAIEDHHSGHQHDHSLKVTSKPTTTPSAAQNPFGLFSGKATKSSPRPADLPKPTRTI